MELKACRVEAVASSESSDWIGFAAERARATVSWLLPRTEGWSVAAVFRLACRWLRCPAEDAFNPRRWRTRGSRDSRWLVSACAELVRCFLLLESVALPRPFRVGTSAVLTLRRERPRLGTRASARRFFCLRTACASDSGPALREADGRGRVRIGLPAIAVMVVSSMARTAETAAARRCISTFWRRGAPEQLLPYRVRRYWISDQPGSVYPSVNETAGGQD